MTTFKFYQSGLHFGTFELTDQTITYFWLGSREKTLNDDDNAIFKAYGELDIQATLKRWQDGGYVDFSKADHFKTAWGAEYQRADEHHWMNRGPKYAVDLIEADDKIVGFQVCARNLTSVLIQPGYEGYSVLAKWQEAGYTTTPGRAHQPFTAWAPMRDGVGLAATVILPAGSGPFPTVMERTPYGREVYVASYMRYVLRGYAVVLQDTRGRGDSEGEWLPMIHEQDDGDDTLDWIAAQPWSNGKVGMSGGSYGGYVQWAAAASGNPHLQAIVSMVTAGGPFTDTYYRRGAPFMAQVAWSIATDGRHFNSALTDRDDWDQLMKVRPIEKIPEIVLGHPQYGMTQFMRHNHYDSFLNRGDWFARRAKIKVPALIQSGWYDDDGIGSTEAIAATANYPADKRRIILGPWLHGGNAQYDLGPVHLGAEALRPDIDLIHQQWFDHFLKGVENGVAAGPLVEYYTVGEERWHTAASFPPAGFVKVLYLGADGSLAASAPAAGTVSYVHDPNNPVPKLISVTQNEFEFPADYQEVEKRPDVVSFTTKELTIPLRIVGQVKLDLWASSSAVDCDWDFRVLDVTPDGQSIQMAEGTMNAKFRDSLSEPKYLNPREITHFTVLSQKTSYELPAGHRLRVDIQSSAGGFVFPNPGTEEGFASDRFVKATQTISCGGEHASAIRFVSDRPKN